MHPGVPSAVSLAAVLILAVAGCGPDSADTLPLGDPAEVGPSTPTGSASSAGVPPSSTVTPPGDPTTPARAVPSPAGDPLTLADSGRSVTLTADEAVSLRLPGPWVWHNLAVFGDAVQVYPVDHVTDPGYQEWVIQAVRSGTARLWVLGDAQCPPGAQCLVGDKEFKLTLKVTGG